MSGSGVGKFSAELCLNSREFVGGSNLETFFC